MGVIRSGLDVYCSRWSNRVSAKRWKVSSPFALLHFFSPKSEKYPILNPKKRRKLLIYMLHLSALSSLITSFRFPNQRSQMFMLQPVGYYYVLTVCQCCWTQTQSCTDWFNKVYKTQQKVPGLSPPVVSCSLEQDSCNRIITTTTSERIGVQEHSSSSSMSPLLNATSVYIYHTLKKDESNNTKKKNITQMRWMKGMCINKTMWNPTKKCVVSIIFSHHWTKTSKRFSVWKTNTFNSHRRLSYCHSQ